MRRAPTAIFESCSIDALADEHGTPLYLYSAAALRSTYDALAATLPARCELLYSLKANPNPAVAAVLRARGAGAEIASSGELELAARAGFEGARTVFAGPGKTDRELARAAEGSLASIYVEGLAEASRLSAIAASLGRRPRVCLRINPARANAAAGMIMGGRGLPFGVDEAVASEALRRIDALPHVELVGVHVYAGTQILSATGAADNIVTALRLARAYEDALGRSAALIGAGPGLGVPSFAGEERVDVAAFGALVARALEDAPPSARILLEVGRFLVAEAGVYVATVIDTKISQGTRFAVLDGGMHHHAVATGGFGNLFRRTARITAVNPREGDVATTLVGPCCTPLDRFGDGLALGALEIGDRILVHNSGAYGLTASPIAFLSHDTPAEILVEGSSARVIRRAVSALDAFVQ